jgi:hypothetical protein
LKTVDGKARLVSDQLCDGLGACLGECPRGAIQIERREAEAFDEAAVEAASKSAPTEAHGVPMPQMENAPVHGGCPGSRLRQFYKAAAPTSGPGSGDEPVSELNHWPIQLGLLPPDAPVLREASLLVAADCVPVAYANFHARLLRGRAVLIGCPKFDDVEAYTQKLTAIIQTNNLREIVVARMQVPCCMGIVAAVVEARRLAGIDVPVREIVIGVQGELMADCCLTTERCGETV